MKIQKRIAAIHDISGFGKCSLTVALPVLSAAGFEVSVVPTAVLSTHTAVKPGFTCHDLTDDMLPFVKHWKSIDLSFDAIYSGYLGSTEQIDIVCDTVDMFKTDNTLVVVDPAMADNGKMYALFDVMLSAAVTVFSIFSRKTSSSPPSQTTATPRISGISVRRRIAFSPPSSVLTVIYSVLYSVSRLFSSPSVLSEETSSIWSA